MNQEKLDELRAEAMLESELRRDIEHCAETCFVEDIVEIVEEFEKQMQHYGWTFDTDKELCEFIMQWR